MSRPPLLTKLISLVEPACNAAGYDLVDLRFVLEQGGWILRVCIDLPLDDNRDRTVVPEDRVDLTDCEEMSRELSAVLDVEDPIKQPYSLEVGSPGIDRALRTPTHFKHFVGADAKIQLGAPLAVAPGTPNADRKNFKGILRGVEGDAGRELVLIDVDGTVFRLPIAEIETARIVPDWDAVMRGKSGIGEPKPNANHKPGQKPGKKHKHPSATHAGASQPGANTTSNDE